MRYILPLFAIISSTLAPGASHAQSTAGAPATGATKLAPRNAATLYQQAFTALPELSDAERKLLLPNAAAPPTAARALVAKAEPALKLCFEASRIPHCDWELDLTAGGMLALPHLGQMEELAQVALLKARLVDSAAAAGQHVMVLRMARHTTQPPVVICRLMGIRIEARGMTAMAAALPQWDQRLRNRVRQVLTSELPPASTISECLMLEGKEMSAWYMRVLEEEVKKSGGSFSVLAWLKRVAVSGEEFDNAVKFLDQEPSAKLNDAAAFRQHIIDNQKNMFELARIVALPRAVMERELAAFEKRMTAGPERNFITAPLLPLVMRARGNELRLENMRALLLAAFDVQDKGESALPASLATYRKTTGGFELTSKELFHGEATTLVVGSR